MKYYVKLENETLEQCIKAHVYSGGYDSVEHAVIDTNISEQKGTKFDVINEEGKVLKSAVTGES